MNLLVIDDEPGVRSSMQMIASTDGWETFSCDQFADIERMIRDNAIDVLFCDYRMPPTTGLQIIRQLRDAGLRLPVVMITANPGNVDRRIARELEVRAILSKPANIKDVRKALADAGLEVERAALFCDTIR